MDALSYTLLTLGFAFGVVFLMGVLAAIIWFDGKDKW